MLRLFIRNSSFVILHSSLVIRNSLSNGLSFPAEAELPQVVFRFTGAELKDLPETNRRLRLRVCAERDYFRSGYD